jgi:protein-tyrosine-phosphatase
MAEALMKQESVRRGLSGMEFSSAGISVAPGSRASKHAVAAMADREIDIDRRTARQINAQMIMEADLILTMTAAQAKELKEELPQHAAKVHTLGEYAGEDVSIDDPYGRDAEVYERTAAQLERLVSKALDQMVG